MISKAYFTIKWIGGGLGWFFGGPLGGVLGFISGTVTESFIIHIEDKKSHIGDFAVNLLMLIAVVMKSDGTVVKSELDYVKRFLKLNFGESKRLEALGLLKEMLNQEIPLNDACSKIKRNIDHTSQMQLVGFLYNLAKADGNINNSEQAILNIITQNLGVNSNNKQFTEQCIEQNSLITEAYKILRINPTASIDEIKKAYRKLANKYHPDKVDFLGEEETIFANDNFQKITNAYEIIKREKNIT